MKITQTLNNNDLVLAIFGRIDTITSNQLSEEIDKAMTNKFEKLVLDFGDVDYISSAGLRIIIVAQKKITAGGLKLELTNMNETVKNVFDITGFSQILNIK